MSLAPIVLFVYNRPWHTEQTLRALGLNKLAQNSVLYVYADGPKENASIDDINRIEATREVVKNSECCKQIFLIESKTNKGLKSSVIEGISAVVSKYGKVIVLEDDLITSPYFLTYCNNGLDMYSLNPNVYAINAYQFQIKSEKIDTFLCPLATSSWGWATWESRWKCFNEDDPDKLLIQNHALLRRRFNIADYDYASMLDNKKSWAIHWYYSVFKRNGLGLFPTKSLVANIGFDGSGENCGTAGLEKYIYTGEIDLIEKHTIDFQLYALLLDYFKIPAKNEKSNNRILSFFQAFKK